MAERDEEFGALRLKYKTLDELRRLKVSMQASEGRELTNDEFVVKLLEIVMKR